MNNNAKIKKALNIIVKDLRATRKEVNEDLKDYPYGVVRRYSDTLECIESKIQIILNGISEME